MQQNIKVYEMLINKFRCTYSYVTIVVGEVLRNRRKLVMFCKIQNFPPKGVLLRQL